MTFTQQEADTCIQDTAHLYHSLPNQLRQLPTDEHDVIPTGEWTKRQILGHCCDGTATNVQRLVRSQYEAHPPSSVYNQAEWVNIQHYAAYDWADLVAYWYLGNRHILHIYQHLPLAAWSSPIIWGTEERSALWFFHHHFVRHTLGHLEQILLDPIAVPPTIPEFAMAGHRL